MKKHYLCIAVTIILSTCLTLTHAQNLVLNGTQTPQQLADALTGVGLFTSNVSGQYNPISATTFVNNGVLGFSLTGGVLLSSGEAVYPMSPATYHHSTDVGTPGDPLLDIIVSPRITEDAAILEFDFGAGNDSVEFNFVMASEEYNEYANTNFNDVFAFFVTGPGYAPNTNVAVLPGTSIPITINTVNNGNSAGTATGPCMNCSYYVDNVGTGAIDMVYDGYTTVIKIKFAVWPCTNYHFKIAIADAGDGVFDSAVMLEENSFIPCPNMQATQHGMPVGNIVTICNGGSATLTAPHGVTYNWTTGETTQSIVVTQPGTYGFTITDPSMPSCLALSDVITVVQAGIIQTPVISQNNNLLEDPNLIPGSGMTYQWNLAGTPITGATQSTLTIPGNGCYTLTIFEGTCESTSNEICVTNTSIYEVAENSINIYPHPVTGISVIETPFEPGTISTLVLYDVSGREVKRIIQQPGASTIQFDRGELINGVYFLNISNSNFQGSINRKIVLQ